MPILKVICERLLVDNATFNFLGITWESKTSWKVQISGFHRAQKSKSSLRWASLYCLQDILTSLENSRFELLEGWNI